MLIFSDHVPIMAIVDIAPPSVLKSDPANCSASANNNDDSPIQYRWDHADTTGYFQYTGHWLQPIQNELNAVVTQFNNHAPAEYIAEIDKTYSAVANVLVTGANCFVPQRKKNFYKFWFDEELKILKDDSIESNKAWKAAGKPRHGPIYEKRQSCRLQYRRRVREGQRSSLTSYTNELHEALIHKNGPEFWKSWKSKFSTVNKCDQVEGCVDHQIIAEKFAANFAKTYSSNNAAHAAEVRTEYLQQR